MEKYAYFLYVFAWFCVIYSIVKNLKPFPKAFLMSAGISAVTMFLIHLIKI